jgi:hypothetical protein
MIMPLAEYGEYAHFGYNKSATFLNLRQWKKKMDKEPDGNGNDEKSLQDMTEKDIFLRAMELFSNTKIPQSKRRRMLEAIEKIALEPDEPEQE